MLRATVKLCCGIAHDPLRRLPGERGHGDAGTGSGLRGRLAATGITATRPSALQARRRMSARLARRKHAGKGPGTGGTAWGTARGGDAALSQEAGAAVASAVLPGLGRVFRAEAVLRAPPARLQRELFNDIERMPEWYPALGRVQVLRRTGPDTLLTHEVTAQRAGDLAGRRDFVSVRRRHRTATAVYLVGTAAPASERAESRLSCMVLQPLDGDPGRTRLTWLLCVDLKGWIPTSVLQRTLPQSQADFIGHLRRRLAVPARP
uniref:Steroidogenic acute regulatory protein, mitochondrial n=1 Tax=Nothoprocta perdicaria TaxID=30464 RepID=A0A8C6ZJJ9_NOTPE